MPVATATNSNTSGRQLAELGGKYLTFFAGSEEYGLQIHKVREIFGMMPVTPVPQLPHHILGVINLRGRVIQVTDFRARVGMFNQEHTSETCIIVVETCGVDVGMVVDKVSEVVNIAGESIEAAPSFGSGVNTDFLLGIGKAEKGVKLLLDIDKVLNLGLDTPFSDWAEALPDESDVAQVPSLFERLKGEAGITAVVDNFYDRVLADPQLAPMFEGRDVKQLRRHQALFVMHATGGPAWTMNRSIKEAHAGLGITEAHFAAVAGHLIAALDWAGVAPEDRDAVVGLVASLKGDVVDPHAEAEAA